MRVRLKSCISFALLLLVISTGLRRASPQTPQNTTVSPTQDDVLRVETDLVLAVFTAVDRDRRFFKTLRQEDLRVVEDGVEQQITLFERETDRPLGLVVLVDTSRSQERTLPVEKRAAKQFVEAVIRPERDRVAVVSFTGAPKIELTLSNNPMAIGTAIDQMQVQIPENDCDPEVPVQEDPRCWTSIWDSVLASAKALERSKLKATRRAIILLTDGDDTSSKSDRDEVIRAAISADVAIYAIGIGDRERYSIKKDGITKLAVQTGGRAFFPRQDAELASAFASIQDELRSQYVIGYSPSNKARDGSYRKIKIEVINPELRKRKLSLVHRQGYYARKSP